MKNTAYFIFFLLMFFSMETAAQQTTDKSPDNTAKTLVYDSVIAKGNIAIGDKNYKLAIAYFKDALVSKPGDAYALYQLQFAQSLLTKDSLALGETQRKTEAQTREGERINRFNRGIAAYMNYENAAQVGNYEDQILFLKQFLNILPDTSELNEYQANFSGKMDFAKKKIKAIRKYLAGKKGSSYQPEAIPYTDIEFRKKYPNINFTQTPVEQLLEPTDSSDLIQNIETSKKVLTETPRLNLSDSAANIKLTCQSIHFKDNYVYLKLCIRNYDTVDFMTGPMQMSMLNKDKKAVIVRPVYVSEFPIVLPQKEFFIVYAIKANKITNEDKLTFEMKDLLKTKQLKISIPAAVFDQEKSRKS